MKTRFCPSPTGYIHIGNLRTAFFNVLAAKKFPDAIFLLRIEDTDQERSDPKYTNALLDDLMWLGLSWDEGPNVQGEVQSYFQSKRLAIYQQYYEQLCEQKKAYHCFCTEEELTLSRKLQLASGRAPKYNGGCWQLSQNEIDAKIEQKAPFVLRFRVPDEGCIAFEDVVRGNLDFPLHELGDFIICRSTGMPSFMFANAVDDALMGVTHVIRGEDHLTNTPRQLLIQKALGLACPQYVHIAMIQGVDGQPLSKRNGSLSARELKAQGYLPGAILNYLARLGHHYTHNDYLDLKTLADNFQFEALVKAPSKYDPLQLLMWQKKAIQNLSSEEFWRLASLELKEQVPTDKKQLFWESIKSNITFVRDANLWGKVFFCERLPIADEQQALLNELNPQFYQIARNVIESHGCDYAKLLDELKTSLNIKGKQLFLPLRLMLTGQERGPEMTNVLTLIGQECALRRIQRWLEE